MDERQNQILRECKRLGENEVRRRLYAGEYSSPRDQFLIEGWLRDKESLRLSASELRTRRIAIWANIIAAIAAIMATIAAIPVIIRVFGP